MCFNAAKRSVVPTLGMLLHPGVAIRAQTSPKRLTDPANVLIALTQILRESRGGVKQVCTYVRTYVRGQRLEWVASGLKEQGLKEQALSTRVGGHGPREK